MARPAAISACALAILARLSALRGQAIVPARSSSTGAKRGAV
jgi:hypothetical protein